MRQVYWRHHIQIDEVHLCGKVGLDERTRNAHARVDCDRVQGAAQRANTFIDPVIPLVGGKVCAETLDGASAK